MTTDKDYKIIAEASYQVDSVQQNPPMRAGDEFPPGNSRFHVIDTASDSTTGFQGMAVVPLVGGAPDHSQVIVAFAGTNPDDHSDVIADVQSVVGSETGGASQTAQALAFAQKVRDEHPGASLETVGHSLGGYLALYVAAESHWSSTTFNGPDPYEALSPQAKAWLQKQQKAGAKPLRNFVNQWDAIGNFGGDGTGAVIYVGDKPGRALLDYHNLADAFEFDERTGAIRGAGAAGLTFEQVMWNAMGDSPPALRAVAASGLGALRQTVRVPAIGSAVGGGVSAAIVAVDTLAALGMASSVAGVRPALEKIKSANASLIPRLTDALNGAKSNAHLMPFITEYDIESVVHSYRLTVTHTIDAEAVDAVDRLADDHLRTVDTLAAGIARAVMNAGAQDAHWASIYQP